MYCEYCGRIIPDEANHCPGCGAPKLAAQPKPATQPKAKPPQEKMKKVGGCLVAIAVVLVVLTVIVIAIIASSRSDNKLELLDHEVTNGKYDDYITGHVKNNSYADFRYVSIEVNLYKDGVLIGSSSDYISNFSAGDTWEFEIVVYDDFDDYKIVDISGW